VTPPVEQQPGRALDLACGSGRHSVWLKNRGWEVTAVDIAIPDDLEGISLIRADLEGGDFVIEPNAWDLIVCWLYWQENLLPSIAAGIRPGGVAALAGKLTGRFTTSLAQYRKAFRHWEEILAGEDDHKAFLITRRPQP
jgi:SAM-dependent methyltransferase